MTFSQRLFMRLNKTALKLVQFYFFTEPLNRLWVDLEELKPLWKLTTDGIQRLRLLIQRMSKPINNKTLVYSKCKN